MASLEMVQTAIIMFFRGSHATKYGLSETSMPSGKEEEVLTSDPSCTHSYEN